MWRFPALVSMMTTTLMLSSSVAATSSSSLLQDPVFRRRVGVAQCRSTCLGGAPVCTGPVCTECWKWCEIGGEEECEAPECSDGEGGCEAPVCGEGCQTACSFYRGQNRVPSQPTSRSASSALKFATRPRLGSGCSLQWGQLVFSENSVEDRNSVEAVNSLQNVLENTMGEDVNSIEARPRREALRIAPVFVVFIKDKAGSWYEIVQTAAHHTRLPAHTLAKLERILVVAVDSVNAVLTSYSFLPAPLNSCQEAIQEARHTTLSTFQLSLERVEGAAKGGLGRAFIRWTAPGRLVTSSATKFKVTWQMVPDGYTTGSLLTNDSAAMLPLLPNASVLVQVGILNTPIRSGQLLINNNLPPVEEEMDGFDPAVVLAVISLLASAFSVLVLVLIKFHRWCCSASKPEEADVPVFQISAPPPASIHTVLDMPSPLNNAKKLSSSPLAKVIKLPTSSPLRSVLKLTSSPLHKRPLPLYLSHNNPVHNISSSLKNCQLTS